MSGTVVSCTCGGSAVPHTARVCERVRTAPWLIASHLPRIRYVYETVKVVDVLSDRVAPVQVPLSAMTVPLAQVREYLNSTEITNKHNGRREPLRRPGHVVRVLMRAVRVCVRVGAWGTFPKPQVACVSWPRCLAWYSFCSAANRRC